MVPLPAVPLPSLPVPGAFYRARLRVLPAGWAGQGGQGWAGLGAAAGQSRAGGGRRAEPCSPPEKAGGCRRDPRLHPCPSRRHGSARGHRDRRHGRAGAAGGREQPRGRGSRPGEERLPGAQRLHQRRQRADGTRFSPPRAAPRAWGAPADPGPAPRAGRLPHSPFPAFTNAPMQQIRKALCLPERISRSLQNHCAKGDSASPKGGHSRPLAQVWVWCCPVQLLHAGSFTPNIFLMLDNLAVGILVRKAFGFQMMGS